MPAFRGKRAIGVAAVTAAALALASCASSDKFARKVDPKYGVTSSPRVVELGERVPKGGGVYRVGKPYVVAGRTYVPEENTSFRSEGLASWYGRDFHGRLTANGEVFDMEAITAAHPTLPMPSYVRVTNLSNKRSLIVRVNDRGPFHGNRVIDLSHKSADLLGFKGNGVAKVRVEYIGRAAIEGSDDRRLAATLRHGEPAPAPIVVASAGRAPIALPESPRGVAVGAAVWKPSSLVLPPAMVAGAANVAPAAATKSDRAARAPRARRVNRIIESTTLCCARKRALRRPW